MVYRDAIRGAICFWEMVEDLEVITLQDYLTLFIFCLEQYEVSEEILLKAVVEVKKRIENTME